MEQVLTRGSDRTVRVAFARVLQLVGWLGLAGLLILVVAAWVAQDAWSRHRLLGRVANFAEARPIEASVSSALRVQAPVLKLPSSRDIPVLLNRIERAAVGNDLPWTTGDYRFVAATEQSPASIEVRCALRGPYPKLRAMVAEVLGIAPAVTFREMSFSRQAITAADVDAKFLVVVFLADERLPQAIADGGSR